MLAQNREGLPVIGQLDIGVTAGPRGADHVRPAELQLTGTGELNLLEVVGHHLDVQIEGQRNRLLPCQIVGHRLEDLACAVALRQRRRRTE